MIINLFIRLSFVLFIILFSGCSRQSSHIIKSIVDLTGDEAVPFEFNYDQNGRLISLGQALITYESDKVTVGKLESLPGFGQLYGIVYHMEGDKLLGCEAKFEEIISGKHVNVLKKTTYTQAGDTMVIESKSYSMGNNPGLLKTFKETRLFSRDGKLMESRVVDSDKGNMTFYYRYCSNIVSDTNINLQAYAFCTNGPDDLFAYLLNLYNPCCANVLPSEILLKYPDGNIYSYYGNYRMVNDYVTRLEVMQDYEVPVTRIEFEYN